ncbi:MAG: restriction endonuclease [Patescibacteria group bacterium]
MLISHFAIDKLLGKKRVSRREWETDRQLISYLRGMKPSEFEDYIAELFQKLGYKTDAVGGKSDGGIDVVATKNGTKHYIQCKKYISSKVSVGEMRDFYGAMADFMAGGKGFFITTNIFTHEAEQFAEGKPIELVDQFKLINMIRAAGGVVQLDNVVVKQQSDVCPRCGGKLVTRKGSRGEFIGCSCFPKCRYTRDY